ncbi:unnamed protein product [Lactuca virosa]|uniref:Uncharacterized protein n=1 Tax=Lactuca virosa TaxID=75947 RepID=A0AAU9N7X8_9ASTR|nr:unnamed protein product [Lactuca virosa]
MSSSGPRNQPDTKLYTKVAGTQFYLDPTYHESHILQKESDPTYHEKQFLMSSVRQYHETEPHKYTAKLLNVVDYLKHIDNTCNLLLKLAKVLISGMINFPVRRQTAGRLIGADPLKAGLCRLKKISTEPRAHRRTWFRRSERLIGADPLKAGRFGIQYIDLHPRQQQ